MTEEMKKRIEEAAYSYDIPRHFNCYGCCQSDSDYEKAFKAGAKFILEMPEMREAVKSLNYYSNEKFDRVCFLDHSTCEENYGADARKTLEALKKAGLL